MKHLTIRIFTLAMLTCPALLAQTAATPQAAVTPAVVPVAGLKTPSQGGPPATLAAASKREIVPGHKLTIVTTDKPLLRQDCKVEKFDEDRLVCRGKSAPVTYSGKDLVAVIGRDQEFSWPRPTRLLATLGISGGALAGAALLASIPTAGIPLAVVGGILLLDSIFEAADMEGSQPKEHLLYLNPEQNLQINLK